MKKIIFYLLVTVLLIPICVNASYMKDYKTDYIQPDGTKVVIYTTGDEYFRYTHDKNGYVLMQNDKGYMVYATLKDEVVTETNITASEKRPSNAILVSDINMSKNKHLIKQLKEVKTEKVKFKKSKVYNADGQTYNFKNLVVFIRFNDSTEFVNSDFINEAKDVFGINEHSSSVKNYVKNVSNNKVSLDSNIMQYNSTAYYSYNDTHNRGYYLEYSYSNTSGYSTTEQGDQRLHQLLINAIKSLPETTKANVDGNNDGFIDNITFVVAGSPSPNWADVLWPHKWDLRAYDYQTTYSGALTTTYNLQFADELNMDNVSTYTHEMMHSLGIDDYYRYYDEYGGDPVWAWDMMNYNLTNTYVNSYIRYTYGVSSATDKWVDEIKTIEKAGKYELNAATTSSKDISYLIKTSDANQFIQVEYRKKSSGENNIYDANLYSSGLLVSRINKSCESNRGTEENPVCDEYYIYRPNEIYYRGHYGGGYGNIQNAAIAPCTTTTCNNVIGSRNANDDLSDGVLALANNTNTQIVIKNVKQVSDNKISFEVFPKGDNTYLERTSYTGLENDTYKINPISLETATSTYMSSNTEVATVNTEGLVTLVGVGTSTITVTTGTETDTFTVDCLPTSIEEIDSKMKSATSIEVTFVPENSVEKYFVYRSEDDINYEKIGETTTTTFIDNDFELTKAYYYRVGFLHNGEEIIDELTTMIDTSSYLPKKVTNINAVLTKGNTATITFNQMANANSYIIKKINNKTFESYELYSNTNTYIDDSLIFGTSYSYQAKACIKLDSTYYCGEYSDLKQVNTKDYLLDFTSNIELSIIDAKTIKIDFEKVEGATSYDIYRSISATGKFIKIKEDLETTTYTDTELLAGTTYYYKVAPIKKEDDKTYRGFVSNAKGLKLTIKTPSFAITNNTYKQIKIDLEKINGVTGHQIYYKTSATGAYKLLVTTTKDSYTHSNLILNKTYYYKVRSYVKNTNGTVYSSFTTSKSLKNTLIAPKIDVITNSDNQVTLNITKVSGATKYKIYKNNTLLTTTSSSSYKISNLNKDTNYTFKVTPVNSSNISGQSTTINYNYNNIKEKINDFSIEKYADNKLIVTFEEIKNIDGYILLRSTSLNGTYTKVLTSTTNEMIYNLTSYIKYYYKVAAITKDGNVTYYSNLSDSKSYSLKENKLKTYINVIDSNTITLNYSKVKNATKYNIYELIDEEYKLIKTITSLSYKVASLEEIEHTFKIQALDKNNNILDESIVTYNFEVSIPNSITSFSIKPVDNKNIKIIIDDENTNSYYQIYRSTKSSSGYTLIKTTTDKEITLPSTINKTYYYKIRVYNRDNNIYSYGNYTTYKSYKLKAQTPTNVIASPRTYTTNTISFNQVNGASGYQIYYKSSTMKSYKLLTTTTKTTYTHTKLQVGKLYYYKVRSYTKSGLTKIYSPFSSIKSVRVVPVSTTLSLQTIDLNTIKASWNKVSGATSYKLYMLQDETWTLIGNTSSLNYSITGLEVNNEYTFKVIPCYKTYNGLQSKEKSIKLLPIAPSNFIATQDSSIVNKVKLSWNEMTADGYEIFLEGNLIEDTANNYYIDSDLKLNKSYKYSIRSYVIKNEEKIYSETINIFYIPKVYKVSNVKITDDYKNINITFEKKDCVDGVQVYRSTSKTGNYTLLEDVTNELNTPITTMNKTYYYKFVPYKLANGIKLLGHETILSYKVLPHKVENLKAQSTSYNKINISFTKDSNVSGYKIYYATSKNGTYKLLKTTTTNSYTHTGRTFNKTYYYKVRAYKIINKTYIYGPYTEVASAITKLNSPSSLKIARYNYSAFKNKVSFGAVSGATGYYVYKSNDGVNFSYIGYTTKTYYIDKKASNTKTNYYKIRAYRTVSGKKIFGDYSSIISLRAPYEPHYSVISSPTNGLTYAVALGITNKGSLPMYILNSEAILMDRAYPMFDRKLYLLNDNYYVISQLKINANTYDIALFKTNTQTWYDSTTYIGHLFIYDGVKYRSLHRNDSGTVYDYY